LLDIIPLQNTSIGVFFRPHVLNILVYGGTPPVLDSEHYMIMWDKAILTDLTVAANRPDIVYHDKRNKKTLLIDVACPCDSNVALKQTEKLTKYEG